MYTYNIRGKLIRISPLTTQFNLCSQTWSDGNRYREFATSYIKKCEISVENFLINNRFNKFKNSNSSGSITNYKYNRIFTENPKVNLNLNNSDNSKYNTESIIVPSELEFHELFLIDLSSEGQSKLIDIPIIIKNIFNPNSNSEYNNIIVSSDINNIILTRRFFLIDNESGIQGNGNYLKDTKPIVIRFPKSISLNIELQETSQPKIYKPYIEIEYRSKLVSSITYNQTREFSFEANYTMRIKSFIKAMLGITIALTIIILILSIFKIYAWRFTHPNKYNTVSNN